MCCPQAGPPPEKWSNVVGRWYAEESDLYKYTHLMITEQGEISLEQKNVTVKKSFSGYVSEWNEDNFTSTCLWCFTKRFFIEEMPYKDESTNKTKMRVNGMLMVRD